MPSGILENGVRTIWCVDDALLLVMIWKSALQSTCDVTIVGGATWLEVESVQNK